jgi:hypothetical protein
LEIGASFYARTTTNTWNMAALDSQIWYGITLNYVEKIPQDRSKTVWMTETVYKANAMEQMLE